MNQYYLNKLIKVKKGRVFYECINFAQPKERFIISITFTQLKKLQEPASLFTKEEIERNFKYENLGN